MNYIKRIQNRIVEFHRSEVVSYEIKNFYLVMSCSIPILLVVGFLFMFRKSDSSLSMFGFSSAVFVILITIIASITNTQKRFSYFYSIALNFFIVPIMFFLREGVYFGMVLFFALGIILTVVLLGRQKLLLFIVALEFVYDIAIIIYSYVFKDKVYFALSNIDQGAAIALSFTLVAAAVIFIFLYQNYIHREIRHSVMKDNTAIAKAENTKGRFLANMTHEIRTPMNAIIGMTDLILKEELSKNAREHADTIKAASSQLLQIINNILEFSKLDSGRAEIINNEYSFRNMISEIVSNITSEYSKESIKLHVFISKKIPDKLFGDAVRIKQVLRYLLFSPITKNANGTVNLDIDYDYDSEKSIILIKLRIASTGGGLKEEDIEAIYNAYSNYDSRQKTDYNRTGLEVSICQKILNMMDGGLRLESIEGIGTAVELSFKNYVIDDEPIVDFKDAESQNILIYLADKNQEYAWQRLSEECGVTATYVNSPIGFRRTVEHRQFTAIYVPDTVYPDLKEYIELYNCEDIVFVLTTMKNKIGDFGKCKILRHPIYLFNFLESINGEYDEEKYSGVVEETIIKYPYARVLCVDDSFVNLKVLQNMLKEYDIKATICKSGAEALELVSTSEFDIMLIDHKMPEMDGAELITKIKELKNANSSVPMICATADFGPTVKENLVKEGFTDYLAKPINVIYLARILDMYIPEDLKVVKVVSTKVTPAPKKTEEPVVKIDPIEFKPSLGIANLGDNKEAYISVLSAFYNEGLQKLADVPKQFAEGDISLYTTNVHALKSSSATVGCMGISPMFKALEFAGKDNDIEFIKNNSEKTFELFVKVLDKIRDYLEAEGALKLDEEEESVDSLDEVSIDVDLLNELKSCILSMNLRRGEEIIDSLLTNNYGSEINSKVRKIKDSYDNFEYMEIKTIIEEIV